MTDKIKAIFFDVDGTIISHGTENITKATKTALEALRKKGIKLFVATGRHKQMLTKLHETFHFDGYITMSGQYCYVDDKVLRAAPMKTDCIEELIEVYNNDEFSVIFFEGETSYINFENEQSERFYNMIHVDKAPVAGCDTILKNGLYQAVAFVYPEDEDRFNDLTKKSMSMRWHRDFLDIIPTEGGKHFGVDAILNHFDLTTDDVMAFGDGNNDLTMLQHVKYGVAMGSASDALRAVATYQTEVVEDNGVCNALVRLGLLDESEIDFS